MSKYLLRSIKYLIQLSVLITLIYGAMVAMGYFSYDMLLDRYQGWRGPMLIMFMIVLAAAYPKFGFASRQTEGDMKTDRERILSALDSCDYSLLSERDGEMVFHARSLLRKLLCLWEDELTVTQQGNAIVITGIRKQVVNARFRLQTLINNPL